MGVCRAEVGVTALPVAQALDPDVAEDRRQRALVMGLNAPARYACRVDDLIAPLFATYNLPAPGQDRQRPQPIYLVGSFRARDVCPQETAHPDPKQGAPDAGAAGRV